ncbi:hypothetical protein FACS1894130_13450 [Spirochaetia bacterium]|nr:hypothetical protein FACS1894130_13450 [Spirochaetia bacterium]
MCQQIKKRDDPHEVVGVVKGISMMQKESLLFFLLFLIISVILFFSGLILTIHGINRIYLVCKLSTYNQTEKATIKKIYSRYRAGEDAITFSLNTDGRIYTINIMKTPHIHVNESVDIIFNKKHDFFIIKQYKNASLFYYIGLVIISIVCVFLSFKTFEVVKAILHASSTKVQYEEHR